MISIVPFESLPQRKGSCLFNICGRIWPSVSRVASRQFFTDSSRQPGEKNDIILLDMCMLDTIKARRQEIYDFAGKHKAEKLWVFGSCARKEERADSDIDLLVKFYEPIGLLEYCGFENELTNLLGRKVELTTNTVLKREPRFAARVCKEAIAL